MQNLSLQPVDLEAPQSTRMVGTLKLNPTLSEIFIFIWKLAGSLAYIIFFQEAYIAYLPKFWGEWGFDYFLKDRSDFATMLVFAVLPAVWLRSTADRPSVLFNWAIYIIVFVPSLVVSFNISPQIDAGILSLWLHLTAGFALMSLLTARLPISVDRVEMPPNHGVIVAMLVVGVLTALVLVVYGGSINIFAFTDIYAQRMAAREQDSISAAVYAYWWLSAAIFPLGLVWGIHYRKWLIFALSFAGQILMFGVAASKLAGLTAFATPIVYAIALLLPRIFGPILIWGSAFIVFMAGVLATGKSSVLGIIISTVLARMLGIPGLTTSQYNEFFQSNPHTYWSHVKGVSSFIEYPYARDLPFLFGSRLYGNDLLSWNAHFWATDGIAAFGLTGILIISLLAGAVLRLLDQACRHIPPSIAVSWALTPAVALANIGLFTAILTQGLGFMILMALFLPAMGKAGRGGRLAPNTALR